MNAQLINSEVAGSGFLDVDVRHPDIYTPNRVHTARRVSRKDLMMAAMFGSPRGKRIMMTDDPGSALILSDQMFVTNLSAIHTLPSGHKDFYDLGSGLTTNVGSMAIANDYAWAQNCQTLLLANYHASGTGTTADAATDIALQTAAAPTSTTAQTGTQSTLIAANSQKFQTTCTLSYTSTLAITEWGLFTAATLSATTGTPFTACSTTSATVTGTPLTASSSSVRGEQQYIVVSGSVFQIILSNTTSALTLPGASWWKTADGTAGTTPGNTAAYTLQPVMTDHRVFSAINVVNGSTIAFTYQLTIASGG